MGPRKTRILIVDDEFSVREGLRRYFEGLGYEVLVASQPDLCPVYDHQDCSATNRCADIIFIDQNMPNMTGLDFIRRQAERGCKLPPQYKLVMTGNLSPRLEAIAKDFGCRIIQKPFSQEEARDFVLAAEAALESEE